MIQTITFKRVCCARVSFKEFTTALHACTKKTNCLNVYILHHFSKSDFSFALLLVTFEPLDKQQSYIPLLKALRCGINAVGAQGCSCMSTFYHAPLKIVLLLHKMANECKQPLVAVFSINFLNELQLLTIVFIRHVTKISIKIFLSIWIPNFYFLQTRLSS